MLGVTFSTVTLSVIMLVVIFAIVMLSVIILCVKFPIFMLTIVMLGVAFYRYTKCPYAECRGADIYRSLLYQSLATTANIVTCYY
jgi:hypothetical protein